METIVISTILVNICIGCFACVGLTTAISMIQSIINDHNSEYSFTLDAIKSKLINTHGGYLMVRYTESKKFLDYLAEFNTRSVQSVEYGKNLTDVKITRDHTERITALIPLGAKKKTTDEEGNEVESDERVDITSVNDGLNYIYDDAAVKEIGWIWATEVWDDVTLPGNLLRKAKARLAELIAGITSMELTIVDESDTGADIGSIHARQFVNCLSPPHGIDGRYACMSKTVDYLNSSGNTITIGANGIKMTSISAKQNENLSAIEDELLGQTATIEGISGKVDGIASSKMYRTELIVDGVSIFKDKSQNSRLFCKVYSWDNDITAYTKDADGNLIIDPEQAEVVKRIYREYLEGLSMDKIAAGLERDGILTGAGGKRWHTSTINKILRNEKYIGDALLQKTYTTDFLNKTRVKNNGLVPQYYVEGNHEAIIPKDIYLQVQEELVRRRVVKTSANGKKRSYSCNHCFSQIVICGECGEMFRRLHWNNRGVKSIVWRCLSRLESTGLECHARTINELVLQDAVVKAINQMLGDKSSYQAQLQLNIASVIRASQAISVENIDEKLMVLQQELIQKAQSKEAYDEIADEIFRLRELRQQTTVDTVARGEQIKRINDLQDYIAQQTTHLTEFDESLVRRWIKQITIWDDHITVELKSGVNIDVDA